MSLQEEKACFMAMYLGQEIFRYNEHIEHVYKLVGGHLHDEYTANSFLLLRTVEQLSDDELIKCCVIQWPMYHGKTVDVNWAKHIIGTIANSLRVTDYLRSRGILLPWREYSTEQLISMGWAKVREVVA